MELSGWDEEAFRRRVRERAAELDLTIDTVMREAGTHHDVLRRQSTNRKIETLERLAAALKWTLPEIMGFESRIDVEVSALAYAAAQMLMARLPRWARTDENFVEAHATLYDLVLGRKRDGNLPDGDEARAEIIDMYVEMLERFPIR